MAIKLVAKLRMDDGMSGPLKRVSRHMNDTEKAATRLGRKMQSTNSIFNKFGKGAGGSLGGLTKGIGSLGGGLAGLVSKLNPVALGLSAIGAAAAGAYSAVKVFNATVGEAMKMQQSEVIIGAMFDDKALSDQYMKMMDKVAVKSPLLDSQAMYSNSKSFVALSKDTKQLEKMWGLTERLVASDPSQGLEGAVFALRELFSGDAISMIDRFEMPKQIMNDIKKLPLEKQMARLDQYMNKMGFTTELIDKMGNTALGKWTQVKEKFQIILRDMGEPALKSVSNFLNKMLNRLDGKDMAKFGEWGGKVINSMVTGLTNSSIKLYDWFTALINDPEFKSKTTLTGKINFVVDDIEAKLRMWYEGGGKDKLITFGSEVTQVLIGAMDATDEVAKLGAKMGSSIWQGVINGIKASATESPIGKVLNFFTDMSVPSMLKKGVDATKNNIFTKKGSDKLSKFTNKWSDDFYGNNNKTIDKQKPSHSGGLDRVPYSGYEPVLHKDEMVLTAQNAREYRNGGSGGSGNTFNFNIKFSGTGSLKKDAEALMDEMAKILAREGLQMG